MIQLCTGKYAATTDLTFATPRRTSRSVGNQRASRRAAGARQGSRYRGHPTIYFMLHTFHYIYNVILLASLYICAIQYPSFLQIIEAHHKTHLCFFFKVQKYAVTMIFVDPFTEIFNMQLS